MTDIFKNLAEQMARQIERNNNPMLNQEWLDAAHQRVMDHINEMITTGSAKNIPVMKPRVGKLTVDEQNQLDDLENGIFG